MEIRRGRPPHPAPVTPAEERVLRLVRSGMTNVEIALQLGISVNTVRYHVSNLLGKANAATRAELLTWQPDEPPRRLRRMLLPVKLASAVAVTAGLTVVAVVAAGLIASSSGQPAAHVVADPTVQLVAPPRPFFEPGRVARVETVAMVRGEGESTTVEVLDATTGETMVSTETGYRPLVTWRRSADELLVSHLVNGAHVLDIFDVSDGLALKHRIPTPDRPDPKVLAAIPWMGISANDRYYAYSSTTMRTELPECEFGGDGPSCTRSVVNILDLADPAAPPFTYELPRHCGIGNYRPRGDDGFAVGCMDGSVHLVSAAGFLGNAGAPTPRFERDPVIARNEATAILTIESDDGWTGVLMSQGAFVWTRPNEPEVNLRAIPTYSPSGPGLELGGGRLLIGYMDRYYDQYPVGLAIFDMASGTISEKLPGFNIGRTIVTSGPDTILAVTQDGRLVEVEVSSGTERTLRSVGVDSETVLLVR